MKTKWIFLSLVLLVLPPAAAFAVEQRGELILYKQPLFELEDNRRDVCQSLFDVESGKDVADMRGFRDFWCQGRYTVTLEGDTGRTVTLFGGFKFRKDRGFMVIRKTDTRKVWLINLDLIPADQWIKRPASKDSGGVEIFFRSEPQFSQNISSVKWGKWWNGDQPQ
ncbi:hypothetical protein [Nitrospina watsonii]|uniref:Uncharacterized protein n=1 Tax=Nitrospina watsonii TaxID=1323948 RepID=A0ABN8VYU0_9BACT|nr:hypothetical protein [Nitrospina watsonii]CAI2718927.1 conserved exported protein of unknown function [Nitrospina watsonii]